jgi:hypothetical protein
VMRSAEQQAIFREGIAWLEGEAMTTHQKAFVTLTEAEQVEMLTPLSAAWDSGARDAARVKFFGSIKNLTADGYYTSYSGLVEELGYQGNQALSKFEGCVHEH